MSESSPCLRCGACCSTFRVSFYWAETSAHPVGRVPVALTNSLGPVTRCMQGTDQPQPRCVALRGTVGEGVSCAIYAERPSVCHEVQPGDACCAKARAHHGLPPLPAPGLIHAA
ncbi:MAG TPA: YkgJ family cysteine cluster protein [Moraxellaceae bacterium]|nr:YkgJ family cysteine cluster protein [Moraxellaceae bacterium]